MFANAHRPRSMVTPLARHAGGRAILRRQPGGGRPLAAPTYGASPSSAQQPGSASLDDLMAADDLGFQSIFLHILAERAHPKNYARMIGTLPQLGALLKASHEAGHDEQAEHFRAVFGDADIVFNYEEGKPNGDAHIVFRSRSGDYRIFLILPKIRSEVVNSEVRVLQGGVWSSAEDFLKARAAAAAPAAP